MSGIPVEAGYGPDDGEWPGQWPYTRGPYASMYRSKLWTMRQFAGFGTAADTNARFRELLRAGGSGLSTAFDMPTLMGRDSDDPLAIGEVGRAGVAVDTLADMETLFAGIDLGKVTTSMTINSPAAIVLGMYVVVGEKTGVERSRLGGTIQNDILKEYQAQKEFIFPPRPSLRLVTDVIRFARQTSRAGTRCRSRDTTFARRARLRPRSWRSRWPTGSRTSKRPSAPGWLSTSSRPD
jgi:methylmalonyl-CoA mutase N-terminal domain/subunit